MRAIILAAGIGKRLGDAHSGPKSLLNLGGHSLLARHIAALRVRGVLHIAVCVGYEAQAIRDELCQIGAHALTSTVLNPDFTEGSVVSLWAMRDYLTAGGDILLMDADVLYDPRMLTRLQTTAHGNCFLLDRNFEAGLEPVKLCVRRQQIVEFRKQLAADLQYDFAGESVGFFRFSEAGARQLADQCDVYVRGGRRNEPYEDAIRDLLLADPAAFGYEDVTGIPWVEIDFPDDVRRARAQILPQLPPPETR